MVYCILQYNPTEWRLVILIVHLWNHSGLNIHNNVNTVDIIMYTWSWNYIAPAFNTCIHVSFTSVTWNTNIRSHSHLYGIIGRHQTSCWFCWVTANLSQWSIKPVQCRQQSSLFKNFHSVVSGQILTNVLNMWMFITFLVDNKNIALL